MRNSKTNLAVFLLAVPLIVLLADSSSAAIMKRSFVRLGCMGQYNKADFAALDHICEECYNLYREAGLHSQCRSNCFTNMYFTGCVKSLLLEEKQPEIERMVNGLYGGSK